MLELKIIPNYEKSAQTTKKKFCVDLFRYIVPKAILNNLICEYGNIVFDLISIEL